MIRRAAGDARQIAVRDDDAGVGVDVGEDRAQRTALVTGQGARADRGRETGNGIGQCRIRQGTYA